jgi:hypothetical protein
MQNIRDFTESIKENTFVLCFVVSQHITSQIREFTTSLNDTVNNLKTVFVACVTSYYKVCKRCLPSELTDYYRV